MTRTSLQVVAHAVALLLVRISVRGQGQGVDIND